MPAAPTYGPWFFNHEKGQPVIKRQRFNPSGARGGWEYLEGDFSKLLALLEITGRTTLVRQVPGLEYLGIAADEAYINAHYHLPGAVVVPAIPRRIDEEQSAIIGSSGKVAVTVTYAYDNLIDNDWRNCTSPEPLWLHNPEARELGMDPWREIIGIDCERPPVERYILEFYRPSAMVRDAASTSLVVNGNHIIYCQAKTARRMGLA